MGASQDDLYLARAVSRKRSGGKQIPVSLLAVLAGWLGLQQAAAQYSFDHQTNILNSVTNNGWPQNSDYVVGGTTSWDALIITNGGALFDLGGFLAAFSGSNNSALVTGAGSRWNNSGVLGVGWAGSGNSVVINNGGRLANNADGQIGRLTGANSNSVLVTDAGSSWSNRTDLYVGYNGAGNSLRVSNGGMVVSSNGFIGGWSGSTNNSVCVGDPGSIWTNRGNLYFSYVGSSRNSLVISNGGQVFNGTGFVGSSVFGTSLEDSVLVTGLGSVWSNRFNLIVGYKGGNNSLTISNGGLVINELGYVGEYASSNNSALITGSGSRWTNRMDLYVGTGLGGNSLSIRDGGQVVNGYGYVGLGGDSNRVLAADAGSVWNNTNNLTVGLYGAANSLVISNGALVASEYSYLGVDPGSSNNSVQVTGTAAYWKTKSDVFVGYNGGDSRLVISNGGQAEAARFVLGNGSASLNNSIQMQGGRLIATNAAATGSLSVGNGGQGRLVLNGGTVTADYLIVTNGVNSLVEFNGGQLESRGTSVTNNLVFAVGDGAGSAGFYAAGGTHSFADGVRVHTNAVFGGCGVIKGTVLVEGTLEAACGGTSIFMDAVTNWGRIEAKNGTSLVFYGPLVNHGQVIATNGAVRYFSTFQNSGTLRGNIQIGNNVWTNSSDGRWGKAVNWSLGIPDGGVICLITNAGNKTITIDAMTASLNSNSLTILGLNLSAPVNSTNTIAMQNSGISAPLQAGFDITLGAGARLVISNGALKAGWVGQGNLSVDGEMSLSAANLMVTNGSTRIGQAGSGQMTVLNTSVSTRGTFLGCSNDSSGLLTVSGSGSVWNDRSGFRVGDEGHGSSLVISNGATVFDYGSYIGYATGSRNNSARVTSGGVWQNTSLYVGYQGPSNSLVVAGGSVSAGHLTVGEFSSSGCDNLVRVDSGSLYVTNGSADAPLEIRRGKLILNGGLLKADKLIITNACGRFTRNGGTLVVGSLVLSADLDADGDGLPNGWEQTYGLDPLTFADAGGDNDRDGMSNLSEYLSGTNPTNSPSCFRITSEVLTGNDLLVEWAAVGGKSYVLQTSTTPAAGFADLSPVITVPGSGDTVTNYLHAGATTNSPARYYRVRLAP
jgi:T5SS/PEP-CTERM-associated repeat protein